MYKDRRIAVVVPAFNEARHIESVISGVPEFVDHLIVVDDCSQDETFELAKTTNHSSLMLLQTPTNQGVGGATTLGYLKALELQTDVVAKMDGDGQMDPDRLTYLLDAIIEGGYDYAKGNRFMARAGLAQMPTYRLLGNIILTFVNKVASGYWHIFDPQNGYTAIKSSTLALIDFTHIHQRYFFENDMLIALNFQNARVSDVPIPARYGDETSHLNPFKVSITFPLLFIPRFWRRIYQKYVLRDFSPIALFLVSGILLFGWGVAFGAYHWILSVLTDHAATTGTVMLAVLPLILGFQLILQAIVLDIQETPK